MTWLPESDRVWFARVGYWAMFIAASGGMAMYSYPGFSGTRHGSEH
jgi:hypothetical protein